MAHAAVGGPAGGRRLVGCGAKSICHLSCGADRYDSAVAESASSFEVDPVVVLIDDAEPTMTLEEWFALLDLDEPVELSVSAAQLLAEAREAGEA